MIVDPSRFSLSLSFLLNLCLSLFLFYLAKCSLELRGLLAGPDQVMWLMLKTWLSDINTSLEITLSQCARCVLDQEKVCAHTHVEDRPSQRNSTTCAPFFYIWASVRVRVRVFMAADEVLGWSNMRREVVSLRIQRKTLIVTFSPIKGLKWKPDVEWNLVTMRTMFLQILLFCSAVCSRSLTNRPQRHRYSKCTQKKRVQKQKNNILEKNLRSRRAGQVSVGQSAGQANANHLSLGKTLQSIFSKLVLLRRCRSECLSEKEAWYLFGIKLASLIIVHSIPRTCRKQCGRG